MSVTRDQFSVQLDRLIATFGDKAFSDQRVHLIWEALDGLDYANVITITSGFIRESRYAPLPADFAKAAREFRRNRRLYALGEIQPAASCVCMDCGDSGFVRVARKDSHEAWAVWRIGSAPCHCDRGRQLIEAGRRMRSPTDFGPQFEDRWLKSYEIMPAWDNREQTFTRGPEGCA